MVKFSRFADSLVVNLVHGAVDRHDTKLLNTKVTPTKILVVGMGSWTFGKERKAVSTLSHMHQVKPHFLTSKWDGGNVSRLAVGIDGRKVRVIYK